MCTKLKSEVKMDERIEKLMHNLKERQFKPFYADAGFCVSQPL